MEWQVVTVKSDTGKNVPFVSIGRGQLDFNAVACDLVGDEGQYKFAQFLRAVEKKEVIIGVKFLTEYEENAIAITRKKQNDKTIAGMTIRNKNVIEDLFGAEGLKEGVARHNVMLVAENILRIL